MKKTSLSLFALLICYSLIADVRLPKIFGAHMVLQRGKTIPVWGWANPKEKVTVQFNHQTKTIKADKTGKWMVHLDQEAAGGPYSLTVNGKNALTITDVYVGEVWICSGQSNMEMPIEGWGKINHYQEEIAAADYPMIRHIKVPNTVGTSPQEDITGGEWEICSPSTAGDFTAVGYFFARELYNTLKIPIGLINTSWGGTMVETWTSREAFENSDEFKNMIAGMPSLNLDSLSKARSAESRKTIEALQGSLDASDADTWKEPNTPDSQWPQMQLPGLWESRGLAGVDGVVWFRKTINIVAEDAGKPAQLSLAMIDDNDITYMNGVKAGSTNGYNEKRSYDIPAGVLKAGENVIAVRVEDTGGGGGLYGDADGLSLTVGAKMIALSGDWHFKVEKLIAGSTSIGPNSYPTLLFNAMVNPLIPYAMAGVIWYQGESNAGRAYQYSKAFPLMINDWRSRWKQGDFPFYFVQLASFNAGNGNSEKGSSWAELREAQTNTLALPNTGMAVTTDIGNATDIHPKNKQDVGKRLAAIALHNTYGSNNVYSGPMYESMKTDGNKVTISFTHTGSGLMVKDKYGYLKGFEIAGADKQFHYAKAYIDGSNVIVFADEVTSPVAVRYGWCDFAGDDNLFNKEGFPAAPFRTDTWKGITEETKYTIND
ncbi:MAG TPA: sialate O-acetylesterase [Agriterribacter sp.]|nr:sialate O-acetylesterase [Agriterribacter sp.]